MVARGDVLLNLTFGPSKSPYASRAVSYAKEQADETAQVEPGVWRVSFRLGGEESRYGEAIQLLCMVGTWKPTVGRPVPHECDPPSADLNCVAC